MAAEMNKTMKVGIISCSGEELPEGTVSRNAVRKALGLCAGGTVTLCLPLFLAGNEGERNFARNHPTVTVDGCDKQCARRATEKHGAALTRSLVVTDILGGAAAGCRRSVRGRGPADEAAADGVAAAIVAAVEEIRGESTADAGHTPESPGAPGDECRPGRGGVR